MGCVADRIRVISGWLSLRKRIQGELVRRRITEGWRSGRCSGDGNGRRPKGKETCESGVEVGRRPWTRAIPSTSHQSPAQGQCQAANKDGRWELYFRRLCSWPSSRAEGDQQIKGIVGRMNKDRLVFSPILRRWATKQRHRQCQRARAVGGQGGQAARGPSRIVRCLLRAVSAGGRVGGKASVLFG
jgi:hypothetical protein